MLGKDGNTTIGAIESTGEYVLREATGNSGDVVLNVVV